MKNRRIGRSLRKPSDSYSKCNTFLDFKEEKKHNLKLERLKKANEQLKADHEWIMSSLLKASKKPINF